MKKKKNSRKQKASHSIKADVSGMFSLSKVKVLLDVLEEIKEWDEQLKKAKMDDKGFRRWAAAISYEALKKWNSK